MSDPNLASNITWNQVSKLGDAHASQHKAPTSPYQGNDSKSQVTTIKLAKCRTAYLTYNLAAQATGYPSWFLTRARTDLGGSNRSTSSLRPTQGTWLQNSKRANLHLAIACPSNAQIWYTRDHGAAGSQNASAAEADRIRWAQRDLREWRRRVRVAEMLKRGALTAKGLTLSSS